MRANSGAPAPPRGDRRRALVLLGATGAAFVTGTGLWLAAPAAPVWRFADVDAALRWIDAVVDGGARPLGPWSLAQVLEHAAQSVEYSIVGYPTLRSPAFRATLGALAFAVFDRRGRMTHDTDAPLPGAPPLQADSAESAAQRLRLAFQRFEAVPASAALPPHFAFGALDKARYRRAHLMHLADHAGDFARPPR